MIRHIFKIHRLKKVVVGKIYQQIVKPVPEWSTYNYSWVEKVSIKNEKRKWNPYQKW